MTILKGLGVSSGSAIGPVALVARAEPIPSEPPSVDVSSDLERISSALNAVADALEKTAKGLTGDAASIISASAEIARDPGLVDTAEEFLQQNQGPAHALQSAVEVYAEQFEELGGYFAERVADLRDVGARGIAYLLGRPMPGIPEITKPSILVAFDLAPVDTVQLDPSMVKGIVTEAGGRTSHTAILASQRGIPAVVQCKGALEIELNTVVGIDGDSGELVVEPDDDYRESKEKKERARKRIGEVSGPGQTKDGHNVKLLANIGSIDDAEIAGKMEVEGCGLFRTEFLHLDAKVAPTVEEQAEYYKRVLEAFGDRPVTVRALDAGADKPLAFADLGPEPNPALGRRGLRLMQVRVELLDNQLAALAQAAKETSGVVKVMAPMVATALETRWFVEKARSHGLETAGVMVEIPAVALTAERVLEVADFVSLGTNDLAQYTMAADRMVGELSELLDPWQPAVLKLIDLACAAGKKHKKPVGVCGEAAGDPLIALVLTGMGVTSLSMSPPRVGTVRYALSLHSLQQCQNMAELALNTETASQARAAVAKVVDPKLAELL